MRSYHTFLDIRAAMGLISSQELRKFLNAKKTFYIPSFIQKPLTRRTITDPSLSVKMTIDQIIYIVTFMTYGFLQTGLASCAELGKVLSHVLPLAVCHLVAFWLHAPICRISPNYVYTRSARDMLYKKKPLLSHLIVHLLLGGVTACCVWASSVGFGYSNSYHCSAIPMSFFGPWLVKLSFFFGFYVNLRYLLIAGMGSTGFNRTFNYPIFSIFFPTLCVIGHVYGVACQFDSVMN
jgi:hypothetical protein